MSRNEVQPEEIPEVAEFIDVRARYNKFREDNAQFFSYLDALQEEYNEKLNAADRVVRSKGVSCGPFEQFQQQTKYDPDALYDLMGRDAFLDLGGTEETVKKRSVDKKRVDMNISTGRIPDDVACEVRKTIGKYRKTPAINVP